ncbi:hypothetical protein D3C80_1719640 [compost metagenome]
MNPLTTEQKEIRGRPACSKSKPERRLALRAIRHPNRPRKLENIARRKAGCPKPLMVNQGVFSPGDKSRKTLLPVPLPEGHIPASENITPLY